LKNNLNEVVQIYNKYGQVNTMLIKKGFNSAYRSLAKASLISTISNFSFSKVYNNRSGVADSIVYTLNIALDAEHCILKGFQLVNVSMPYDLIISLIETQVWLFFYYRIVFYPKI
jgi:hypothetical protein